MLTITARNVGYAYSEALWRMKISGVEADSRNGKVRRVRRPVVTTYLRPRERMLFDPTRDANPFFHIFEGIWMLAGRRDVKWISQFSSNIGQFAEEDGNFHGAYGWRWRNHFVDDQIPWVIEHLRKNPNSRRTVLQMYDPDIDHEVERFSPKDIPCNTAIFFGIDEGRLNMTVTCRSNDIIWGCYGANAVHMSMLQEFVAFAIGVEVGNYIQFSNDWHMYERHFPLLSGMSEDPGSYPSNMIALTDSENWGSDLINFENWINDPEGQYQSTYIQMVLNPMLASWKAYKGKNLEMAIGWASHIDDEGVAKACIEWLKRRVGK